MGWAIGYDSNWHRDVGYGVVTYCDHPKCWEVIDRGLGHICGGDIGGGDRGCGLFFCAKHGGEFLCPRCRRYKPPYKHPKPEHPRWLWWKLNDPSWARWRKDYPDEVVKYREQLEKRWHGFTPDPEDIEATQHPTEY